MQPDVGCTQPAKVWAPMRKGPTCGGAASWLLPLALLYTHNPLFRDFLRKTTGAPLGSLLVAPQCAAADQCKEGAVHASRLLRDASAR